MTLGIIVEGETDRHPIVTLLHKLGWQPGVPSRWMPQGDMRDPHEVQRHVRAFLATEPGISTIFVFVDSECTDVSETRKWTGKCERKLKRLGSAVPVKYFIVDHSLEGWLACDEEALRQVLGPKAKIPRDFHPENDCRPADLLRDLFAKNGKYFSKSRDNQALANLADVQRIGARQSTFRKLFSHLR